MHLVLLSGFLTQRVRVPKQKGFRSQNPYSEWFWGLETLLFGYLDLISSPAQGRLAGAPGGRNPDSEVWLKIGDSVIIVIMVIIVIKIIIVIIVIIVIGCRAISRSS